MARCQNSERSFDITAHQVCLEPVTDLAGVREQVELAVRMLLVAMPGASNSVLAPSSKARRF